jgi:hypothetical protein
MTPYELRFQIFQEARLIATEDFCNKKDTAREGTYTPFPTVEQIEVLADQIKDFVEEK